MFDKLGLKLKGFILFVNIRKNQGLETLLLDYD